MRNKPIPLYLSFYPLFFVALLALVSCQKQQAVDESKGHPAAGSVIKSPNDDRHYEYFELRNGLRALVISDPSAKKAAVSLDVKTGSKDDPQGRQGLAHFLEHMLFLGTSKYPTAGEYQEFIASHGGQHNAYTSFENTNYFFDINAPELEPAIDRFSQFFISPLFTAQYVEREKHAVESEYRAKFKDEARRGLDALKEVLNPEHPFSKFSVGNLETLADRTDSSVRDELLAFYAAHYSANVMRLVVLGKGSTDQLRAMVERYFDAVPDRGVTLHPITQPLFEPATLPVQLFVTPEQNIRRLDMTFPVPDTFPYWQSKPLHMIGDVLGHEGEGSLLQYLKVQGWAEGLSAGEGLSYRNGATLNISVVLTEKGFINRDEVVRAVFQGINRLADSGIGDERFLEQQKIGELRFRYQDKAENVHYVTTLANGMSHFPPAMIIKGGYEFSEYDPGLYRRYLAELNPQNMLLMISGPGLPTGRTSRLYQTPYALVPVSAAQLGKWQQAGLNPAITVPGPNPFIPEQFARLASPNPDPRPRLLQQTDKLSVWHGDDPAFPAPKASLRLALKSPLSRDNIRHRVLLELFAAMVADSLNTKLYPASLAGFTTQVAAYRDGLQVAIDGFSDKQPDLLAMIANNIAGAEFSPLRFADIKQTGIRNWENARRKAPYSYLPGALRNVLFQPSWDEGEMLKVLKPLQLTDLETYRDHFLRNMRIELLSYGNTSTEQALAFQGALGPLLQFSSGAVDVPELGVVQLGEQERRSYEVGLPHSDAAIVYYVQGDNDSNHQRVLMGLTAQIIRTPFYQSLRTEQQFGYVVYAAATVLERMPGLSFVVQSPVADAGTLFEASNRLLASFNEKVQSMTATEFEQHKHALASQINRPHQNVSQEAAFMWGQLLQRYPDFDRRKQLTSALDALTLEEWRTFYARHFLPRPRRSLLVFQNGDHDLSPDVFSGLQPILDRDEFKGQHPLKYYP